MEQTTAYSATGGGATGIDAGRIVVAIGALLLTFAGLFLGFIFLRDIQPIGLSERVVLGVVAIIWGVGGVAVLFFVANWAVESLPIKWTSRIQPYIFVGPAILLLGTFLAVPAVITFFQSLYNRDGTVFVGLQNYLDVFTDRVNVEAWRNNLLWLIVGTSLVVGLGLIIAVLADRSKFEKVAKSLIFLPMAISMVGAGVIWKFVFDVNPNIGMVNAIVTSAGGQAQDWLRLVQPANNLFLIIVMVWLQTGFSMVLISAAIKGIPDDLLEAARVDGAGEFLIFFRIIIPNISGTLITVTTTTVIFTLKVFDIVQVMTGGNFGTQVIGVRFYNAKFSEQNDGLASSIAIVLLLAVIPIMYYNLRQFNKRETF